MRSLALFLIIQSLVFFSCKKENSNAPVETVKGNLTLEVHVMHHSWDVSGIMIYLKKNAVEFPGKDSSIYEFSMPADGYGKATFENLLPGKYYVYASGFDVIWGANVFGYSPVSMYSEYLENNRAEITLLVNE